MCGIFGAVRGFNNQISQAKNLARGITVALRHRGPDDCGVIFCSRGQTVESGAPDFMLGHTRLAIVDSSASGRQPMSSPDGRFHLVFNGEIYNFLQLRSELEDEGFNFSSNSDSEALLWALVHWGEACLPRLQGMFAFAFLDAERHTMLCARDIFGVKPFFYSASAKSFAFASELPALLEFPWIERRVDPARAYAYIEHGAPGSAAATMLAEVRQLPPAHWLKVDTRSGEASEPRQYWRLDLSNSLNISFADAAEKLRGLFLDSVSMHLRGSVRPGFALSGGIDSSSIVCAARHLNPDMPIKVFSHAAGQPALSERAWAEKIVKHTGAEWKTSSPTAAELWRDLPTLLLRQGEPLRETTIYAQYRVFQLAAESGVRVLLEGQGADELLAGYDGFCLQRLLSLLKRGSFVKAACFLQKAGNWPGRSSRRMLQRLWRHMAAPLYPARFSPWVSASGLAERDVCPGPPPRGTYAGRDVVKATLANYITWENLPCLLREGDRNAMAFSLENRVPFLTREMAEFTFSLPENYLVDDSGRSKALLREAMRGIVPDSILDRRDKVGFATGEPGWLLSLHGEISKIFRAASSPLINKDFTIKAWEDMRAGHSTYDARIWRILNYLMWVEMFSVRE